MRKIETWKIDLTELWGKIAEGQIILLSFILISFFIFIILSFYYLLFLLILL